jgi:hypothetical protein
MNSREFSPSIPGSYEVIQIDATHWAVNFTTPPNGHRRGGSTVVAFNLTHEEARKLCRSLQVSLNNQKRKLKNFS